VVDVVGALELAHGEEEDRRDGFEPLGSRESAPRLNPFRHSRGSLHDDESRFHGRFCGRAVPGRAVRSGDRQRAGSRRADHTSPSRTRR
jgi:hypothetical protein